MRIYGSTPSQSFVKKKKYNFINKFGPKKCPDQQIKRSSVEIIYSWNDYAPLAWYEYM